MRKTVTLYQRLYAFSKRTGSTATLQGIPSSEEREVGEPVGGRASHREALVLSVRSRGADSNRLPLLITSDPSPVAGVCTGLQIQHS